MAGLIPAAVIAKEKASQLGKLLKKHGWYNGDYNVLSVDNKLALPLTKEGNEHLQQSFQTEMSVGMEGLIFDTKALCLKPSKRQLRMSKAETLLKLSKEHLRSVGDSWSLEVEEEVPSKWEIHGNTALLSQQAFASALWDKQGFWEGIASCLGVSQLARKSAINNDNFRSPRVTFLLGDDPWLLHVDNGIKCTYDVTKSMFSSGNISEKLCVANFDCTNETVVDLYAGIGYFTLPYLVHAGARYVHACEWNPAAVEALRLNLELNQCAQRCSVYEGDNAKVCPRGLADRVNLGLIPSSEQGWPVACEALRPEGGVLHIHANVTSLGRGSKAKRQEENKKQLTTPPDKEESGLAECSLGDTNQRESCDTNSSSNVNSIQDREGESQQNEKSSVPNGGRSETDTIADSTYNAGCKSFSHGNTENGTQDSTETSHGNAENGTQDSTETSHGNAENGTQDSTETSHGNTENGTQDITETSHGNTENATQDTTETTVQINLSSSEVKKSNRKNAKLMKFQKTCSIKTEWRDWATETAERMIVLLQTAHPGRTWSTEIAHIEHVKSYAPCIDHIVLDLKCKSHKLE